MNLFGLSITSVAAARRIRQRALDAEWQSKRMALDLSATPFWSWREMFKYLDAETPWNELGWALSEALMSEIQGWPIDRGTPEELLRIKLVSETDRWRRVNQWAKEVDDPVIQALLDFGTFRALSDVLPHLILRQEDPIKLRWNTADYCKFAGGPDLYAINDRWTIELADRLDHHGTASASLLARARSIRGIAPPSDPAGSACDMAPVSN